VHQFHRPDPAEPYADPVGAICDLLGEGVILMAGISSADVAQIDEAREVLGSRLASVSEPIWALAVVSVVIPISGASRPDSFRDSAGAADLVLTAEQLARVSA
jgi:aryl-alcohol dehydrogenase-like predicted oxidoreductase